MEFGDEFNEFMDLAGGDTLNQHHHQPKAAKIETVDIDDDDDDQPGSAIDSDDDEPEVISIGRHSKAAGLNRARANKSDKATTSAAATNYIDLTGEEDEEMKSDLGEFDVDDSDIILDNDLELSDLPELIEVEPLSKKELAEQNRLQGNDHFKLGNYNQALESYGKAIALVPSEVSYYANRAACYLMMRKHQDALSDTLTSLQLDANHEKSVVRLVRIYLALGDIKACESAVKKLTDVGKGSLITRESSQLRDLKKHVADITSATARKDYRRVLFLCDRALEITDGDTEMKVRKAYTFMKLSRHGEAGEMAADIIAVNKQNMDAHIIRALCHYQLDNMDKSMSFMRAALQLNPDAAEPKALYKKIKLIKEQRETATELFKQGKLDEAKKLYLEGIKNTTAEDDLKNVGLESKFFFNLALISNKQRNYDDAISNASRAIELNPSYIKAILHRASVYNSKEMYDEAVRDYEAALKIDPTKRELKTDIQNAKMAAKRAKRKDYYKILDITKTATDDDIRKAYKKRAMMHHPDRHASASEAIQKEQEKHFKDVGEAYEVLSDAKKRIRYDQGHDLMDMGMGNSPGAYYDQYDTSQLFNMFFSTGSNMGGSSGRGGGGPRHYQQYGRSNSNAGSYGFHR